ncbi:putative Glycosyltransferase [Globisporangium polare]
MVPKTYATLVTSDAYAMGVEALVYSLLKVRARFPVLVLYTPQVTQPAVDKLTRFFHTFATRLEVQMTRVDDIGIPSQVTDTRAVHVAGWVNSGYTKLHIFRLEQFETIVYIDADAVVLENVDEELFERDTTFAAAPDVFPPDRFNAGVLVIKPSVALFDELMRKAQELASYDGGDTGFLNAFFPNWYQGDGASRLPFGYNAQRTMYWLVNEKNPGYWNAIKPLKILHYSSNPKPWEDPSRKGDLEMLWWQIYTESRCVGF